MRVFYREIIYENHEPVNQKIHAEWSDYLKFLLRGLGRRDLDREVVRRHRAVGAIEPIESDAVFVTDLLGRVDGERSRSGFVLALSVVPAGELSARFKSCTLLAANRCAAVTDARATLPTVDWPADSFTQF